MYFFLKKEMESPTHKKCNDMGSTIISTLKGIKKKKRSETSHTHTHTSHTKEKVRERKKEIEDGIRKKK